VVVGKVAEYYMEDPQACKRVLRAVKRDLAKDIRYAVGSRQVRPVEAAAEILRKLKRDAEEGHFHRPVRRVVLTHPAVFDEVEKERLREAARGADFEEVVLLEEPVAAALAYLAAGLGPVEQGILVYDLGGGTFDLTLVVPDDSPAGFRVALPPRGLRIGGEDFDRVLYDAFDNFVRQTYGASLGEDGLDLALLKHCQEYKENLSVVEEPAVPLSWFSPVQLKQFTWGFKRRDFEELINPHIERTVELTTKLRQEVAQKGLTLGCVLLIGGSSRIPLIQTRLKRELQIKPLVWEQRDVAVALGAATYGARYGRTNSREYRLDKKGSSLEALIKHARGGDVIVVPAGDWYLGRGVIIDKPLVLRGEGREHSRLWSGAEGYVLQFVGTGPWRLEGLTVEHVGGRWANVVVVEGGQIEIRNCICRGGVRDIQNQKEGNGILLRGDSRFLIFTCVCNSNGLHGIAVSDRAEGSLEENTCENNDDSGIVCWESAKGFVRQNTCQWNGQHGIRIAEQATGLLESNICKNNQKNGIACFDSAKVTVRQNECCNNVEQGIGIYGQVKGYLEKNICEKNQECGIGYFDSTGGTARQNTCQQNGSHGIEVQGQAQPLLHRNTCEKNHRSGLAYYDFAGGIARQNICLRNNAHGIAVHGKAQPLLESNICEDNQQNGIIYLESAEGIARRNICQKNEMRGIEVQGKAKPSLERNICKNNERSGILYSGTATGKAQGNICSGNSYGISVYEGAKPTLSSNECFDNTEANIDVEQ
jgi:parallel beta-helix repeat protein